MRKILFIITQAPYKTFKSQEFLDTIFFTASYGFIVSALFRQAGINYLAAPINDVRDLKPTNLQIQAFKHFEIEKIYVNKNDFSKLPNLRLDAAIEYVLIDDAFEQTLHSLHDIVIYDEVI